MKRVTILNKFGPFSNAITGQNAKEIADYLHNENIEVEFICLKAEYLSARKGGDLVLPYQVKELRSVYTGRSPAIRLTAGLLDGFRLWLESLKGKKNAVIVMTDPPLLFLWFQLFRRFSKRKLIYWTMDLYPEAFVAGKYISPSNIIYKLFHRIVYGKIPDLTIVLGREQYAYLKTRFNADFPFVIIPCGVINGTAVNAANHPPASNKITFGYSGNIGEAHDADFLISLASQLDPEKHQMIVSLYGSKADQVKKMIIGNKNVHFRDFLNLDDIASMDINIASLLPEWNHICVPSKAVTAICCGTSLLLNATTEADNWQMFHKAGWLVEAGKDYNAVLQMLMKTITRETIGEKSNKAKELATAMVIAKLFALKELARIIQSF